MGVAFILAANLLPAMGALVLLVAVSCLAQLEFYGIISIPGIPVFRLLGLCCGVVLISVTFFTIGPDAGSVARAYRWEHFVLLASLIAVFVRQFPQKHNERPLATIGCTLLGILYVPYLFNFFTRLAFSWDAATFGGRIGDTGRFLVIYLVVVVKSTDMGGYFAGSLFGKHKLVPRISPAKTWEGLFGGVGIGVLVSLLIFFLLGGNHGGIRLTFSHAVILGALLAFAGITGDMFESLLKRASGAKDSSSAIPGMGGLLDVLDSLLFAAPVLYVYAQLFLS